MSKPGHKRTTIKDVAKEAQVSTATISYVLNGKESISEETKEKVFSAIKKLGYVPNLGARALVSNVTRLVGVLIPQREDGNHGFFNNLFYSEIIGSIEYYLRRHGYGILISATEPNENFFKQVKERNLDGVIAVGVYPESFYEEAKRIELPVVLIDGSYQNRGLHEVNIDDFHGEYLATKYMIEHGHRNIAFFSGKIKNKVVNYRYQGYLDALKESKITLKKELVFEGTTNFEGGYELAEKFMSVGADATAVVCTADVLAIGAIKRFQERGIKIPEDISIIGFDDLALCRYTIPSLTTVCQNIPKKGELAAKLLLNAINDRQLEQQKCDIKVKIIERDSVKRIK